ncbi:MAG: hypothetical protein V1773_17790 [bacterium]
MKTEKVTVKINSSEIARFKTLIEFLESTTSGLEIANYKYGKLGGEAIISFDVDEKNYEDFVYKLNINKFNILMLSKAISTDFNKISDKYYKKDSWENLDSKKKGINEKVSLLSIDSLTKDGKYEELIKIGKDIRNSGELAKYAVDNINTAVVNLIRKCFISPPTNRLEAEERFKILLKIASDEKLKLLQKKELQLEAGKKAIELCSSYKEIVDSLINIVNNTAVHNTLNILAALQFASIVLPEPEKFEIEIGRALRNINLRYLDIAYDVVQDFLSFDQKEKYNRLVDFVKKKRETQ